MMLAKACVMQGDLFPLHISAAVSPWFIQGESASRVCSSRSQGLYSPCAPLLKSLDAENRVGRARVLPVRSASLSLRCSANSSAISTAAEEAKRRGRPKKRQVDGAALKQSPVVEDTISVENGNEHTEGADGEAGQVSAGNDSGERPGHLFQYPDGASEATFLQYDNSTAVSVALAEYVSQLAQEAVDSRRAFSIVLSGGSLIQALDSLTKEPYLSGINWKNWHVFWVDERVVPLNHVDSNYRLAMDRFLSRVSIPREQIHAIEELEDPTAVAEEYERRLRKLVKKNVLVTDASGHYPFFDLILLGIGPDGHIASLFPNSALLAEKKLWVVPVTNSPKPPPNRITFTLPSINAAANVAFVVLGSNKAFVLHRVLERPALPGSLPAQMVRLSNGKLVWFCDKQASSSLRIENWSDSKTFPYIDYSTSKKPS